MMVITNSGQKGNDSDHYSQYSASKHDRDYSASKRSARPTSGVKKGITSRQDPPTGSSFYQQDKKSSNYNGSAMNLKYQG